LQTLYDLRLAQQKTGEAIKSLPRLKRREPVPALARRLSTLEMRPGLEANSGTRPEPRPSPYSALKQVWARLI
jgi:hypothetical protein